MILYIGHCYDDSVAVKNVTASQFQSSFYKGTFSLKMGDFQFVLFLLTGLLLADALLVDIDVTINQLAYIKLYLGLGSFSYSPLPMELEGTSLQW